MSLEIIKTDVFSNPERIVRVDNGCNDLLCDRASTLHNYTPIQAEENLGSYQARNWYDGKCLFAHACIDAAVVERTRAQIENGAHLLFVHRLLRGNVRGQLGDISIDRDPGEVYIYDMAYADNGIQMPKVLQYIYLPKDALGFDSAIHAPFMRFSTDSVIGGLINAELDRVFKRLMRDDSLNRSAVDRLIACLKTAISSDQQDGDVRRLARVALMGKIQSFIEDNLDDPEFSVGEILKNFGVSRASLYRMFETKGGVRQYISDRRLNRAVSDLVGRPIMRGDIINIAEKWGFASGPTFNRSVRRQFGVAPGSLTQFSPFQDADPNPVARTALLDFIRQ